MYDRKNMTEKWCKLHCNLLKQQQPKKMRKGRGG